MEEKANNTPETFLLYNKCVGTLQAINMQYNEETKSMCNVIVFSTLADAYQIKEVYERLLNFMRENDLYERYLACILELQFNPPKQEKQEGESSNNSEQKSSEEKGKGGVGTKRSEDNKKITEMFIKKLYEDEDF